jgi:protein-S-isoprenylcysteine O-methyltransferase Ste14
LTAYATLDSAAGGTRAALTARLIDLAERAIVVIAFLFYVWANYRSHNWLNFAISSVDGITVWFVLTRRRAISVSLNPMDWALAVSGSVLPMFMRPGGQAMIPPALAFVALVAGTTITLAAKLSLNRSFGLSAANRGVRMRGAYVFIRHPMYLSYAVVQLAYILTNPMVQNIALIGVAWACQVGRILREERWLLQDRAYRRYARIVRFRMIPGLF